MTDLVQRLARLIAQDNAVLIIGSELRKGLDRPSTLEYTAEALASRIDYQRSDRTLAAVARDYEVLRGRQDLIVALREALEELADEPGPVHQLIANAVSPGTKVITTRFDQLLERALEQSRKDYVLIVRDTDLPFFDEAKVTVIKLQGDIGQPESLIITDDDIRDFVNRLPTVSDVVRAFFATKTLVFLGYDLDGDHFRSLFRQVSRNMGGYRRRSYAITAQAVDDVQRRYWQDQDVEICERDPLGFLEALVGEMEANRAAATQESPQPEATEAPLPPSPYKALDSFQVADAAIFRGRTEESQRLANRILANRQAVLHGESGSGKTSLLQAGAGPLLAQRGALLAICQPSPGEKLQHLLTAGLLQAGQRMGLATGATTSLADTIRDWQHQVRGPVILALDQFEQYLVSYDPAEQAEASALLRTLVEDRSLNLRLVYVARDDFVGHLQALAAQIPGVLDVRFRLDRLGQEAARAAIEEPAQPYGARWQAELVQHLLDDLYDDTGVAPAQLQIVCDRLYREALGQSSTPREIRLDLLEKLGGTEGILGNYLDRSIATFPQDHQLKVRLLLSALVSSKLVKQRLSLDDLARTAGVEPAVAQDLGDQLTKQRLLQRFEGPGAGSSPSSVQYELTHDYLVRHIARWLDYGFVEIQETRELIRSALSQWENRADLPGQAVLRRAFQHYSALNFSQPEREMLYAAAVAYDESPQSWQAGIPDQARRAILLKLAANPIVAARVHSLEPLTGFPDEEVGKVLVQAALHDEQRSVATAAAAAIARLVDHDAPGGRLALETLGQAAMETKTARPAQRALATIRDLAPTTQDLLPVPLRRTVQRQVWLARWQRHRPQILADTVRGLQGGFAGFGLGLGSILGLTVALDSTRIPLVAVAAVLVGVLLAGALGALSAGAGAFGGSLTRHLGDDHGSRRAWLVTVITSAVFVLPIWLLLGTGAPGSGGASTSIWHLAGAWLVPLLPAGLAAWRSPLPRAAQLALCVAAGAVAFAAAGLLGLFSSGLGAAIMGFMGAAVGVGFYLAYGHAGPARGRRESSEFRMQNAESENEYFQPTDEPTT